jgi:hypothetical protein
MTPQQNLLFGVWSFPGAWSLELGAFRRLELGAFR